jgi:hypothetical protein
MMSTGPGGPGYTTRIWMRARLRGPAGACTHARYAHELAAAAPVPCPGTALPARRDLSPRPAPEQPHGCPGARAAANEGRRSQAATPGRITITRTPGNKPGL